MKLLTPSEIKEAKERETARDVSRYHEVKSELKKTESALAKAGADFSALLASQQKAWALEEQAHREDVRAREKEIEELEQRRSRLLVPIDLERHIAENELKEAHETLTRTKEKEEQVDQLHELFETRLDELEEREHLVAVREWKANDRDKVLHTRNTVTEEASRTLTKKLEDFINFERESRERLLAREREVQLLEVNLNDKFERLQAYQEILRVERLQLDDRAETLKRGFEELRQKNG